MTYQVKKAYAYPLQTFYDRAAGCVMLAKNHPTRPARPTDESTWWEDVSEAEFFEVARQGREVRTQ